MNSSDRPSTASPELEPTYEAVKPKATTIVDAAADSVVTDKGKILKCFYITIIVALLFNFLLTVAVSATLYYLQSTSASTSEVDRLVAQNPCPPGPPGIQGPPGN